jgi:putative peptidoglycan lipid II flippase
MDTTKVSTANRQIARAAGVVMVGFVLSNVVSLIRTIITGQLFGMSAELDAFNTALRLPDIIFSLVAGGALSSAFIPMFTDLLEKDDRSGAWELASAIANLVAVIMLVISGVTWLFAEAVVGKILAPEFGPDQQVLTVSLLRILLLSPIIFSVSGLIMGVLNTHQKFLLPALAPTMYWGGMIFGLLVFPSKMGIYALAWGAVLGSALHLLVQLPGLFTLEGRKYIFTFGLRSPSVQQVGRLMAPRILGVAVVQVNFLVNVIVASGLPEGSLSSIDFGFRIMTMPQVVIAQAIAIAALPTFSAQVARNELEDMRRSLAATLRGILLLSLPATLGLIFLRRPVIAMFYQGGEFTAQDTEMVAWALLWYAVGLVGHSLVEILSRAFYALHDTKTPVLVGAGAMSLNVILSFTLPGVFEQMNWLPLGGLPLANSIATTLEMIVLLVVMRRRLDGLEGGYILRGSGQSILATMIMSTALYIWIIFTRGFSVWLVGVGGIAVGGSIYVSVVLLLKIPEAQEVFQYILQRFRR